MLWLGSIYFECLTIIINRWFLNSNKWLPSLLQMNPQSSEGPDKMKEQKDFWQSWLDATSYKNVCSVIFFSVRWLQVASTIWSSWLPRHLVNANATSSDTSYSPLSPGTIKLASYGWGKKSPKATWLFWPCLTLMTSESGFPHLLVAESWWRRIPEITRDRRRPQWAACPRPPRPSCAAAGGGGEAGAASCWAPAGWAGATSDAAPGRKITHDLHALNCNMDMH